jgi:phytoene dehydrogenase-like protein
MRARTQNPEAIVVGSGPNGLAAAVTIARAGHSVVVYEAEDTIGGGARTAELTLPGFLHDVCSCVHPMAAGSPFFKQLNLAEFGLRWIQPEIAMAHPFDDGDAAAISNPFEQNIGQFGEDARVIKDLLGPSIKSWNEMSDFVLRPPSFPKHPFAMARFGWNAIQPASRIAARFRTKKARAVIAGMAAHSILPLDNYITGGFGTIIWITSYAAGWPFAAGGSQSITNALTALLKSLGGEVITKRAVGSLRDLPASRAVLCDVTPRQFIKIAGDQVEPSERRRLERFRYGPGVFKMDWALDAPIPWTAHTCLRAGTVHIGGTFEEIAQSEREAWSGTYAERPFIILAQPSLFDPSRAPAGKHTVWAYCHVPHGGTFDMRNRIEAQIERFAPGFGRRILARSVMFPSDLESHNANLIGGDIAGGSAEIGQFFFRPTRRLYSTSIRNVFLCSSSTPPGAGVHGMCGHLAAERALRKCF